MRNARAFRRAGSPFHPFEDDDHRGDGPAIDQEHLNVQKRIVTKTLLAMKEGEKGVVMRITGGRLLKSRMDGFGLHEGRAVRLIRSAPFGGPLLVEDVSSGARIMIGRGMADSVEVRVEETP
jgi:ferrous iron transport protein A